MLNLAAAIERAREFDVIHYEAAYYPMSLAFTRLSPTPIVQTLHHSPSAAELKLWAHYPEAALHRDLERAGPAPVRRSTSSARCCTVSIRDRFLFREQSGGLSAVPRAVHRGQGAGSGDRGRPAARHAADSGGGRRAATITSTSNRSSTAGRSSTSARPTSTQRCACTAAPGRCSIPIQAREPFGLVLAEAMACGTPVAALDRGAVREVVDDGRHGSRVR